MKSKLGGILPALLTPLNNDQSLNVSALERLLERIYNAGVDGVYVCGSTGEGMVMPPDTRRSILEIVMRNSPRGKQVIVHVGAWSFVEAQSLARHAEQAGASAISSLPPAGATFAELLEHYRALAADTSLPMLAYYFPAAGTGPLTQDELVQLCAIPGVIGMKYTDYDLFTMSLLVRDGNVVFNGRDEVLAAGLLMGAHGGIGSVYNLVPDWFVELYRNARDGKWTKARMVQDRINDLLSVLLRFPFLPALKRAMDWEGIPCGPALRPRIGLTAEQESSLRTAINRVLSDWQVPTS